MYNASREYGSADDGASRMASMAERPPPCNSPPPAIPHQNADAPRRGEAAVDRRFPAYRLCDEPLMVILFSAIVASPPGDHDAPDPDDMKGSQPIHFFATPAAMRAWLEMNHSRSDELLVGFYKRHAVGDANPSITWPESIAEALCFGWIDGVRRRLDEDRYVVRFTRRRPGSKWSAINIRLMAELEAANRMTEAGRQVFEARKDAGSAGYKARKKVGTLDESRLEQFRRHEMAWQFFEGQPPGYRKAAAWWVMEAKREETRARRLATLIESSARAERLKHFA